ncbi:MAG: hypothetical protein ACR2G8_03760 [Candidatus Limnocylindria bacterium]
MNLYGRGVRLEEQVVLDRLLDDAFAPGRSRRVPISAARVRARVAWQREAPESRGWRAVAWLGRLGETSLAVGMTALLFAGSLGGVGGQTEFLQPERGSEYVVRVVVPVDDSRLVRLLRLGLVAPGTDDVDAATVPTREADEGEPVITVRERGGLLRRTTVPTPGDDDEPVNTVRERGGLLR